MRSTLLYLVLVVVPVLTLMGVIRVGERILPPPYIGGTWRVEAYSGALPDLPCGPPPFPAEAFDVEVTQSGTVLELIRRSMPSVRADARLHGDTLRTVAFEGVAPCAGGWVLEAHLAEGDEHGQMAGRLFVAGCDTCQARAFTATRLAAPLPAGSR